MTFLMLHRLQLNIFAVFFLALFIANAFVLQSAWLGGSLLVLYLAVFGWEVGGMITREEKAILRWWLGAWILLSIITLLLTVSYYVWRVTPEVVATVILLSVPAVLWASHRSTHPTLFHHAHDWWHEKRHAVPSSVWSAATLAAIALAIFFAILVNHPITDAVRSLWERLPASLFVAFAIAAALSFALLMRGRERALSLVLISTLLFAALSIAAIAMPIGFGFDSFIHKATESHLAQFGTIVPKPFYYIGQYALVLFANLGFRLPIDLVDTFLVPALAALLLPMAWFSAAAHIARKRSAAMATLTGVFLLPLSAFIVSTPQALANLWTLLLILASVPYLLEKEHPRLRVLLLAATATLAIHPIAGIPALLFFVFLATDPSRTNPRTPLTNRVTRFALIALACVLLPLTFIVNAAMSGQPIQIDWSAANPIVWIQAMNINVFVENRFAPLLDLVYLLGRNASLVIVVIAALAWWSYRRELSRRFRALFLTILALTINYLLLTSAIEFTFLIDYERTNYASRLVPLMIFFLAPFFILGLGHFFVNVKSRPVSLRATCVVLLVAMAGSSVYLAYPRRDAYETNRGFNVSQADVDAVYLVESWAAGEPYLALANQSVSAAAISEIGFRYFGDLFFYPIPTGGELYEFFLKMNTAPTRETAADALSIVPMHGDVQTLFFLVNNYWWDAPRIIESAKSMADDWKSIGENGQVYVFRYDF